MKLQNEFNYVVEQFKKIKNLDTYAKELKASKKYNDFTTRLAWDCLHMTVPCRTICDWYDKYNCDDTHIDTLAKRALKEVYQG